MSTVALVVTDDGVEVVNPMIAFRRLVRNGMTVRVDGRGRKGIVGIDGVAGGVGAAQPNEVMTHIAAFDDGRFDHDAAAAFIRYWSWHSFDGASWRSKALSAIKPMNVGITWAAWDRLSAERRVEFLKATLRSWGWLEMNGRRVAYWRGLLLRRPVFRP